MQHPTDFSSMLTLLKVLDFGASRDGISASERGYRHEVEPSDVDRAVLDEDVI